MLAVYSVLILAASSSASEQPDHVLVLKNSESVTLQAALGVLNKFGIDEKVGTPILTHVSQNGEGVVIQGSKAGCEKVAEAFAGIGMKSEVRQRPAAPPSPYAGSDVLDVADAATLEAMLDANEPVLVKFYGHACPACHRMIPEYKAAATALKGKVNVAAVNLQALAGAQALAAKLSISVMPTIRFVVAGSHLEHRGQRTSADLVAFAEKAMASIPSASNHGDAAAAASSSSSSSSSSKPADGEAATAAPAKQAPAPSVAPTGSKLAQSKVAGSAAAPAVAQAAAAAA